MTELVPTNGRIPALSSYYDSFLAEEYVDKKFEDSQAFSERIRDVALEMMRNLQNTEGLPGLSNSDRNFSFPDAPSVPQFTVPDPPEDLNIPSITGEAPDIEGISAPSPFSIPVDLVFDNEVINRLKSKLLEDLKAPGGYSPEVEQGIYDRARTRREADLQEKKDQAKSDMAKRGYPAPPGALNAVLRRYDVEDHREETDLNRDIVRQQADLARQKYEFLMQTGVNIDQALRERAIQQVQTGMEKARLQMQFALEVFSSKLRKAEAQSTIYQTEAQVVAEKARVESLRFDAYQSQIQGVQTKADLERIKTQIFSEIRQAETSKYSLQLDQDRVSLEHSAQLANHRRSIAENAATIASQLAASAMTAVSTSAQIGASQSESNSDSYSMSLGRNDGVVHNYSASLSA